MVAGALEATGLRAKIAAAVGRESRPSRGPPCPRCGKRPGVLGVIGLSSRILGHGHAERCLRRQRAAPRLQLALLGPPPGQAGTSPQLGLSGDGDLAGRGAIDASTPQLAARALQDSGSAELGRSEVTPPRRRSRDGAAGARAAAGREGVEVATGSPQMETMTPTKTARRVAAAAPPGAAPPKVAAARPQTSPRPRPSAAGSPPAAPKPLSPAALGRLAAAFPKAVASSAQAR